MYNHKNERNGEDAPLVAEDVYKIVMEVSLSVNVQPELFFVQRLQLRACLLQMLQQASRLGYFQGSSSAAAAWPWQRRGRHPGTRTQINFER